MDLGVRQENHLAFAAQQSQRIRNGKKRMFARNYDRSPDRKPRRRVQRAESFPSGNQSYDDCQRDNSPNECSKLNLFLRLKRHRSCAPSELPFHLLKALERVGGWDLNPPIVYSWQTE